VFEPSPITVCLPAIVLKKLTKTPVFFWVLDLWPESLSATGAVSSAFILKAVGRLVRFIYSKCDKILVPSKGFINQVSGMGFPLENILYFPNWTEDVYQQAPDKTRLNSLPALPDGFKIVFAGNIGAAQSFATILDAAERLKGTPDIHWLIAGDGRMSGWVKEQIELRKLENCVHMLGRHSPETIVSLFSVADALLVTLKREPAFALTVPGKMQSYLACGKPVIASLDGEGGRLIEEAGAGIACPAEDAGALAAAVLALRGMSAEAREGMGERGRKYCESSFTRATLLDKLEGWLVEGAKKYNKSR
jgi:glycosyltransferase involved in cell wall biosynthesis